MEDWGSKEDGLNGGERLCLLRPPKEVDALAGEASEWFNSLREVGGSITAEPVDEAEEALQLAERAGGLDATDGLVGVRAHRAPMFVHHKSREANGRFVEFTFRGVDVQVIVGKDLEDLGYGGDVSGERSGCVDRNVVKIVLLRIEVAEQVVHPAGPMGGSIGEAKGEYL